MVFPCAEKSRSMVWSPLTAAASVHLHLPTPSAPGSCCDPIGARVLGKRSLICGDMLAENGTSQG